MFKLFTIRLKNYNNRNFRSISTLENGKLYVNNILIRLIKKVYNLYYIFILIVFNNIRYLY